MRCSLLFALLLVAAPAVADDWSTFLNGNSRQGFTPEELTLPLNAAWTYAAPQAPQRAWGAGPGERVIEGHDLEHRITFDDAFQVAAVGDRVYFGSSVDHQVRCVDAKTGREIWHVFTGAPVRLAPTVAEGRVYFGSDDGYVRCLDAQDGSEIWKLRAGPEDEWLIARGEMIARWPVRTAIVVDGDVAFFAAGLFPHENVYVYCVDANSGKVVWKRDNISQEEAGRNDLSPQGYLLLSDTALFIPSGRSLPAAFDRKTGQLLHKRNHGWRGDAGGVVGGTQAMLADGQLYSWGAHHVMAMDQKSGAVGFGWFAGQEMAVAGDAAYVVTGKFLARLDRLKYAVNSRERHKLEKTEKDLLRKVRSAKGDARTKLQASLDETRTKLTAIEEVGFVWKTDTSLQSSLVIAGKTVFVGGENEIAAFDVATGKQVWTGKANGEVRGLAVANGQLLASTTDGYVTCFSPSAANDTTAASPIDRTAPPKSPYPNDEWSATYATAAEEILNESNAKSGFCLVVGSEEGRLAWEIAKRSSLRVYCVEPDAEKVARARELLSKAGVYGSRIVVHHAELSPLPYSSYFANLIVSDSLIRHGKVSGINKELARHLKPLGGQLVLGRPADAKADGPTPPQLSEQLAALDLEEQGKTRVGPHWVTLTRGALPGAGSWSHQYGEPGNTACSDDRLVKGGLGVLWFGDPGENKMVNRHDGAVGPLAVNGRLMIQGDNTIMAYDAYNGQFLWEIENPKSIRTGVFQNQNPGNLVASDDRLFFMARERCVEIDAATGQEIRAHLIPEDTDRSTHEWGYLAFQNDRLFGTATRRAELDQQLRRRGRTTQDSTDAIFAIDTKTGKHLWTYQGQTIAHHTIAVGSRRVFFIDSSITSEERAKILAEDKTELQKLTGEARAIAEDRAKRRDLRMAVALDAATGKKLWAKAVDVTDCSDIGIGGGKLTLMYHNDVLVLCGANANGHYWKQFMSGDFSRRRLVALRAEDGERLWAKDGNYRHRPIIVEDQLIAEPWSFDLYTGVQKTRPHPLTGKDEPWSLMRSGHHCGMLSAAPNMLFFRAGYTGYYDLEEDAGTQHFAGHRTGCWINMIPANGLLMIPESSAGCVCLFSISSTIVMEPREARRPWAMYSSVGSLTPVKHLALNFGAPGDRRDANGRVWLSYPRPRPSRETSLDLPLNLQHKFGTGGEFIAPDMLDSKVENTEIPWVESSFARGLQQVTIPLRGKDDGAATYKIRFHFTEMDADVGAGERVFDVKAQGQTVLTNVDVVKEAGGTRRAVVREVSGVQVADGLLVELVAKDQNQPPTISGIEVELE